MANTPKKVKDPSEVALSAIQEALNINDATAPDNSRRSARSEVSPPAAPAAPAFAERGFEARPSTDRLALESIEDVRRTRRPANDDRETIGQILQAIQKGRPERSVYMLATVFAGVWLVGCGLLTISFLPSIGAAMGNSGGVLVLAGLAALFFAPVLLFYVLASLAWRSQELRMIAQSMAQVAIRFSEPEGSAADSVVTVGQAIRREVAAMGDGIERALARAGELETLVAGEVAALERAYSDNEVRIHALLQDIAHQRDNLVGQAEQVRSAISGVQLDLRHDVALISDAIASRVDEVAKTITGALEERGAHLTQALSDAGDNMILALSERGGDLLDRLEGASAQTARAVLDASERLNTTLNFKTDHVHEEFADLADRLHNMLNDKIDRITTDFEQRSSAVVEGISDRTEQVHDSLKNSGDSLLLELELRSDDLISKIDEASKRLSGVILTSGDKAAAALDATVSSLVTKVAGQAETAHDTLSLQINTFGELMKNHGGELAERFARDSGTLGALITRHISEFDRTVKTFGGEIVARMGERTQDIADTLKNYVDNFDARVSSSGGSITATMDQRLTQFETSFQNHVETFDSALDNRIKGFDDSVDGRLKVLEQSFDARARSVTETIDSSVGLLSSSMTDGAAQIIESIESRLANLTSSLTEGSAAAIDAVDHRIAHVSETINGRSAQLADTVTARFAEVHQNIETKVGTVASDIDRRVAQFEDLLGSRIEAAAGRIESSGRQASEELLARAETLSTNIKSHVEDAERALTNLAVNTSETIQTGARAAQQSLLSVSSDVSAQMKLTSSEVERALAAIATGATTSILNSAREAQLTLVSASGDAANQIKTLAMDVERTLTATGSETVALVLSGAREVQTTLVTASSDAANHVKSLAVDVQRSLSIAGTTTADQIKTLATDAERTLTAAGSETAALVLSGAREAQTTLISASSEAAQHVKSLAADVERTLSAAGADTAAAMLSTAREAQGSLTAISAEIERSVLAAQTSLGAAMAGKSDEITSYILQQSDHLSEVIDVKRALLVDALTGKTNEITFEIDRVTSDALKSIEAHGQSFSQSMMGNGADVARVITSAGDLAANALNMSLSDFEQASRTAIDRSRKLSIAAVTEMQETGKMLHADTAALFERLREGNILLQEVLTGAHDNLNSLERALVTRVADLVSAMNDVITRNGTATAALEEKISFFNEKTGKALENLGALSGQFEAHGRALMEAATAVEQSNHSATTSVTERKATLESLVTTIDLRTTDLDQRLSRFTSLLDESLSAADARARDIARAVEKTAGAGSDAIARQFEAVRTASEEGRRQTVEAMHDIYRTTTEEADAMFKQSAEKFAELVGSMKEMAAKMQHELETTRNELRRGVLEMPQEAAESTAQMRKVIVDQIEALAELNRIVAQHGRGLDVVGQGRPGALRQDEQMLAGAGGRSTPILPPLDLGMPAPRRSETPVSPPTSDPGRDGWLSELLSRADNTGAGHDATRPRLPQPQSSGNPLESLSLDIGRMVDRNLAGEMWDHYQRGESKAFTKRLYTPAGQRAFDEVARKYRADRSFKQTVDRYIGEFERLLDDVAGEDRGPQALRSHLTSDTGLVYTLLTHAAGHLD